MIRLIRNIAYTILKDTLFYRKWKNRQLKIKNDRFLISLKEKENSDIYAEPIITEINLNANDVCNSHCVMCNIWQQGERYEFTPSDLETILKDPLYKHVKSIGVTGGEPTLRKDLSLIYESIFNVLPDIENVSTITNCINQEEVKERIDEVIGVCKKYNKPFSMMISLDGVSGVHEKVRGTKGNFDSAINVYKYFASKGINIVTGTTISKINVWEVDELLDYLKENKMYGRFRVAEFINRLYNENNKSIIRNFDEDETYHLILFFYKLIHTFEDNESFQRTYKSIISVLSGNGRLIGCPYHAKGLSLNSRGELAYCAPKSKIIGEALKESSYKIFKDNLNEKMRIFNDDCYSCIHDYHAPITYREKKIELEEEYWKSIINLNSQTKISKLDKIAATSKGLNQIFITGWYGTETVGDKAILGQIINELKEKYSNNVPIIISSIYPLITQRTLKELNVSDAYVVQVYSEEFISYIKGSEYIVMGGGPLMDLDVLAIPLTAFRIAKRNSKTTIIYGCGLGPLYKPHYIEAVKELLNISDFIKLRDQKSIDIARDWLNKDIKIELTGDPARKYLRKYTENKTEKSEKKILMCFLRELTYEYSNGLPYDEFEVLKQDFETSLVNYIKKKALEIDADEVRFDHMHNFFCGMDDRDFSRHLIRTYFKDFSIPISYNKKLSTIESVTDAMSISTHNICMRFHSVVFAETLGTEYTAIDYTQGGKILNFLKDNNKLDMMLSINDLIHDHR